jgi:hypothetical protein
MKNLPMKDTPMNADILPLRAPEALRRRLAAVPEFDPPAWLDARVHASLARPVARRRAWLPVAAVAAAIVALAATLLWRPQVPQGDTHETAWVARSRGLEQALARVRPASEAPDGAAALEADLARVDRALQAAYDRGADTRELAPLWQQRTDTLDSLVTAYRSRDGVVRI